MTVHDGTFGEHRDQTGTETGTADSSTCPHCNASLIGEPILEERRDAYGGATHFRREVALYSREKDRTVGFQCPDCGGRWR